MKKLFVMLALAGGTMGAFAQTETDSTAVVNKGITPVKEVYPQKEEDGDLYHGLTRKLTFDRMIPPYGLEVTYDKTTHIIFPSSVRYVDLGSPNLIAGTVSYTHLDVYKRQSLICLANGLLSSSWTISVTTRCYFRLSPSSSWRLLSARCAS